MAPCRLSDGQHLLAEHAGAARPAGRGRARRLLAAVRGAPAEAGRRCFSRSRPTSSRGSGGSSGPRSTAGRRADRRQHDRHAAAAAVAPSREAGGLSGAPLKALRWSVAGLSRGDRRRAAADRRGRHRERSRRLARIRAGREPGSALLRARLSTARAWPRRIADELASVARATRLREHCRGSGSG